SSKVPVEVGRLYEGSIHALVESGTYTLYLEFWNSSGSRIAQPTTSVVASGGWSRFLVTAVAPEDAVSASVLVYSAFANTGRVFLDDASIGLSPHQDQLEETNLGPAVEGLNFNNGLLVGR